MSETKDQLNPAPNSGAASPNLTIVEPHKTVSPNPETKPQVTPSAQAAPEARPQVAPSPQTTPGTNPTIAFHSAAIGTQTARPKDYFAEQNQQTLTKKQAHSTKVKRLLILACGLVAVALVVGIIWFAITRPKTPIATPEEVQETVTATYDGAFDEAMGLTDNSDPSVIGPTEESINAATEIYNQAIEEAGNDSTLTTELRLSQMKLYIMTGDRYEEIIRLGKAIDPESLSIENRSEYYNDMAEAYWMLGNRDEANRYYDLIFELSGGVEYGG